TYTSQTFTLDAGTYSLSEIDVTGYTEGTWSCNAVAAGAYNAGSVTIANGGSATCEITNNDQPAHIIVDKVTLPAGSPTVFTYTTTGSGYSGFTLTDLAAPNDQTVAAGEYSITETLLSGWLLTDLSCTNGATGEETSGGLTGKVTVTVANGETVTCTYVNQAPLTTRTQGFWATHAVTKQGDDGLTLAVWFGGTWNGITYAPVDGAGFSPSGLGCLAGLTHEQLLGGFWANIAKTSAGDARGQLGAAKMQLLQQLLAAILNNNAFSSAPSMNLGVAVDRFCNSTDISAVREAASAMAGFNESGDSGTFTPGGSANGKGSKDLAGTNSGIAYWDWVMYP
ncbi:MAG: hypothetical protein WC273_07490, partial [Dehalococcoidia bacterium]